MQFLPLQHYEAVIWDCDGVLIDSEILACSAVVDILNDCGGKITLQEYLHDFMGKTTAQILGELGISKNFPTEKIWQTQKEKFKKDLRAMPGIYDVLNSLDIPVAIASGSSAERLEYTLKLTGLFDFFKDRIYSAEMVKNGKPAPDIFLLAAEKLGVSPQNCLVIEDSPHGIKGAKAADMGVYAFTGGSHITPALHQTLIKVQPDAVFSDMRALMRKAA